MLIVLCAAHDVVALGDELEYFFAGIDAAFEVLYANAKQIWLGEIDEGNA